MHFNLLQFADDILLIFNGNLDDLWTIKVISCGFEFALGLCVNFNKSEIFGINLQEELLPTASNYLACYAGYVMFTF